MNPLTQAIDHFFNANLSDVFGVDTLMTQPNVNIYEEADKYIMEFALAGVAKEDLNIQVDGDKLTVFANKTTEETETKRVYKKRTFDHSKFRSSFYIPDTVDTSKIKAAYKHGILKLKLQKLDAESKSGPVHIEVQ